MQVKIKDSNDFLDIQGISKEDKKLFEEHSIDVSCEIVGNSIKLYGTRKFGHYPMANYSNVNYNDAINTLIVSQWSDIKGFIVKSVNFNFENNVPVSLTIVREGVLVNQFDTITIKNMPTDIIVGLVDSNIELKSGDYVYLCHGDLALVIEKVECNIANNAYILKVNESSY